MTPLRLQSIPRRADTRAMLLLRPVLLAGALQLAGTMAGGAPAATHETGVRVTVAPMATVRERPGITGAGWGVAYDISEGGRTIKKVVNIYPNHPDDWGKTAGTGASHSLDGGATWLPDPDNSPINGMVDMWQDLLRDGSLLTLGIKVLPDRKNPPAMGADGMYHGVFSYALSRDRGATWRFGSGSITSSAEVGPIARPLPRVLQEPDGSLLMPAYSWNQQGNVALLLKSTNLGETWRVLSTIATATAVRAAGVPVTMPWFEHMVARVSDGSLLAVIRTASNSRGELVAARSTDQGATWSPPERVVSGPARRPVAGKLPNLCLLPNGVLVLLTAHTRDHCRIYLSLDGTGRQWSEAFVITSQSGGNTSLVGVGRDRLLVFTPATGRIACWDVSIDVAAKSGAAPALPKVAGVTGTESGVVEWAAPPAGVHVSSYLVTPILLRPPEGDKDMQIYAYAPIRTRDAATRLDLGRMLARGATYRMEVAAIDREGRISPATSSAAVTIGSAPRNPAAPP